ncbi:UNVERIFIED_CONTAM: hypothetical protein NCL1_44861 [Trichonephila clavipes]
MLDKIHSSNHYDRRLTHIKLDLQFYQTPLALNASSSTINDTRNRVVVHLTSAYALGGEVDLFVDSVISTYFFLVSEVGLECRNGQVVEFKMSQIEKLETKRKVIRSNLTKSITKIENEKFLVEPSDETTENRVDCLKEFKE